MFGEWIPILLFYGLVIGITLTIGLFVSINIPLLVFDKSIQLFNFLTGSNFLNQLIFTNGDIIWNFENTFFLIYLIFVFIAFIVGVILFIKASVAKTFDTEFGNTSNKSKFKWSLNFVASILLIPFGFIILNSITTIFASFFNDYLTQTNNPLTVEKMVNIINGFINQNTNFKNELSNLINLIEQKSGELIQQQIADQSTINQAIQSLNEIINKLDDNNNSLNELVSNLSSQNLTTEQIQTLNDVSSSTRYLISQFSSNPIQNFYLDKVVNEGDTVSQPFLDLKEQLNKTNLQKSNLNNLLFSSETNITLEQIAWLNNPSSFKVSNLTLKISELIVGQPIYNLYSPLLTVGIVGIETIKNFFTGDLFMLIIRIVVFIPTIGLCSAIMFNIIIQLMKRVISIIGLLISSPIASVSAIEDGGIRWNLWLKTSLNKFCFITIAAFALMLYRIILPQLFNLVSTINLNNASGNDLKTFLLLINVAIFVGTTYGVKKLMDFGSELIGETQGLGLTNGIGSGAKKAQSTVETKTRNLSRGISRSINKTKDSSGNFNISSHPVNQILTKTKKFVPKVGKAK